jgi:hypothetical protein
MPQNEGKYPVVTKLPKGAVLVKEYAKMKGVSQAALYMKYSRKAADFKIIIYYERNFIVPG